MLWRESQLRARAGAMFVAEIEVLPLHSGPGSAGKGLRGTVDLGALKRAERQARSGGG